ncbi:MAG TPA: sulfatase-like hydrolase/transferase [Paludibaculum sp.]|jgi:arylsulfatase A-like enzyme
MTTRAEISRRAFVAGLAPAVLRAAPRRPNVVFFMTDDHGAWANGAYGCADMRTPNVDRLAREGMKFTRAFAATPVCSPSRMTWLTGQLPSNHGVQDWLLPKDAFGPESRRWLAGKAGWSDVLAANGYTLGMTGKWHMGQDERAQSGFSYWATVPGGSGPYKDAEFVVNGEKRRMGGFKEDAIGSFALDFIDQNKSKPFCLMVPFYAPHTPYNFQPEADRAPYENARFECFPEVGVHPDQNRGLREHHGARSSKLAYSALVTGMDRNIGRVLARLEELRLREDTVVIFTADQGWNAGHHGVWGKGNGTVPYNMYEESIRVPLVWSHAGRIRAGTVAREMVSSYDFFPTLVEYLGLSAKPDPRRVGMSYRPSLEFKPRPRRDELYFEYAYMRAVRGERYKYVERTAQYPSELYDLQDDPNETRSLDDPARREKMAGQLRAFFQRAGAPPLSEWRSTTAQTLPEN